MNSYNFNGIFLESWIALVERERSWERCTYRSKVESDLSVRLFNRDHRPCVTSDFSMRERGTIYRYAEDISIPLASSRSTKKGKGRRGKERGKKWNGLSTRFDFWSASADDTGSRRISDLPPRFLAQSTPSTFVSYTCATRTHQPREGVPLKPYFRYRTRERKRKWSVFSRHEILLNNKIALYINYIRRKLIKIFDIFWKC